MHGNHVCRIRLQPSLQLVLLRNLHGKKARVTLMVPIVLCIRAISIMGRGAHKVDGREFSALKFFPEFEAPTDIVGDAIAKGHVADVCISSHCGSCSGQR
jgi:hypothetical protein